MKKAVLAAVVLVVSALLLTLVWSFSESLRKPTVLLYPYEIIDEDRSSLIWEEFGKIARFRLDNDDLLHLHFRWFSWNISFGNASSFWLADVLVSIWHKEGSVVKEVHVTVIGDLATFALKSRSQYPGVEAKVYLGMLSYTKGYEVRISDLGLIGENTLTVESSARYFGWPIEIIIETSVEYNARIYRAVYDGTLNVTATN